MYINGMTQASSLAHDQDVENDWESEMIKRGARKSESTTNGGTADSLFSASSARCALCLVLCCRGV